ncbi:hypothetical protein M407DRAFT_174639 [Tulasnella calospora MUT 4182]|uniref:Uncharacterized protein n=1 Tax=Tulasnella calospora MUT 4182 TaxID=1051891 RepID=A0A0C3QMD8_9AGAM|nr:hypothetical protein M407DRAFT_174639 [Tulasnella calospora MUT 4182]
MAIVNFQEAEYSCSHHITLQPQQKPPRARSDWLVQNTLHCSARQARNRILRNGYGVRRRRQSYRLEVCKVRVRDPHLKNFSI